MDGLSATDLQIFREKSRAFIGSVKIPLDKLRHEELPDNPRQRDEKNVTRLLGIFQSPEVGCQRRDSDNHVPVLIPRSALPSRPLGVDNDFQLFNPDHPLTFLHGRHRIEAARKFFTGNDRWWIADLYSDDLSLQVKNVLREHDPSCAKFYDGDVLRQIRISTIQGDTARREKFLARLSDSKQDYVKRLEALSEQFWDSLDALIPFAGLWPAILIGTFLRLSNLHCPEEMTRYLRRVKATMVYIIGENENDWFLIDANTAFLLQGLCPGLSLEDRAFIQMRMLSRELFPAIQDDNIRSRILERICSIKYVIITIYTFQEDTKYLEPCTRILKKVLPGQSKGSLSQYFNALHNGQPNVKVQTTESTFDDRTFSSSYASWVAYRVLWLLALRHFPEMDGQAPRKDSGKRGTRKPGLQPQWWIELSALALGNGYRRIRKLYRNFKAADSSEIEDCVQRIRPSMEQEVRRRKVQLIYQIIGDLECGETMTAAPELTSDRESGRPDISDKCGRPDISYRCGRPHGSALQADEGCLFFDHIYSTSYDTAPKRYLTSFAITRDFFHSFFGTAEDDLDQQNFFRLPPDNHGRGREDEERMQDVDDAEGPPANQRPAPPPPPEVPLPSNPTRPVENTHSAVTTSGTPPMRNSRSPDGYHSFTRRGRSASPTTHLHRSGRPGERSNSTSRQRRRDLTSPRGGDTIFPEAVQQLLPAERTQAAAVSSEDVSTGDMEIVSWAPPSAGPLVENAHTAIAPRSRSLDGHHNISARRRSASPTTQSHRSGRSDSTARQRRRDLTSARSGDSRIRDTIFPGSAQQLLPAGPPLESTQTATVSEDVSIVDMEMVPWAPPSAGELVNKARTAVASRSRSLDERRKITQRGRSTSPTIDTHRSERRRERSTSSHRERQRSRGSGASPEDMEIVQWVLPPRTAAEPLVQHSHSATIPSVSALRAAQPSVAPIFSQEIRDRTFSTLPDIQLSAQAMLTFSEPSAASTFVFSQEAQSGTISALAATQPAAATMSVLRQDRTISALPATQPSTTPLLLFGQERLIEDITISLQDASRLIFRRQIRTAARSFMVLSHAGRDRFRLRKADPTDTASMVNALQLPSEAPTITLALASDQGKRLKLAAPTTILEEARAQKLDVALVVSRLDAGEVVRQLEGFEEPGEELRHKEPQPSLTVNEIVKRNGKPIQISIWDGSSWKIAARNVTYSRTEEKVRFYMLKVSALMTLRGLVSMLKIAFVVLKRTLPRHFISAFQNKPVLPLSSKPLRRRLLYLPFNFAAVD